MTKKRRSQIARDACSKGTDLALPEQGGIAPVADDSASPDIEGSEDLWLGDREPVCDLALASLIAARRLPLLSEQLPLLSDQHLGGGGGSQVVPGMGRSRGYATFAQEIGR